MRVHELVTGPPVSVPPAALAHEAAVEANRHGVHYLLVVDSAGDLRGITCMCDVSRAKTSERVGMFAHGWVTYILEHETAERAQEIMRSCKVGCLPVLRPPGTVLGVVTRSDLRRAGLTEEQWPKTCASCGSVHGLSPSGSTPDAVMFCKRCLESTPPLGSIGRRWYCTLGSGD